MVRDGDEDVTHDAHATEMLVLESRPQERTHPVTNGEPMSSLCFPPPLAISWIDRNSWEIVQSSKWDHRISSLINSCDIMQDKIGVLGADWKGCSESPCIEIRSYKKMTGHSTKIMNCSSYHLTMLNYESENFNISNVFWEEILPNLIARQLQCSINLIRICSFRSARYRIHYWFYIT